MELNEINKLNPKNVTSRENQRYWALYASFYEKIFQKIDNFKELYQIYKLRLKSGELNSEAKDALTFFYRIRRDELNDPKFWDKVQENKGETMKLVKESLNESVSRHCAIYMASDEQWYLELANAEHGDWDESITYGPFRSEERAEKYLDDNFSNPGGMDVDDSGEQEPPTSSPDGSPVKRPNNNRGATPGGYRSFGGFR